jgi:hypothetical protein
VNEKSFLDLTLTQHPCDEDLKSRKARICLEVDPPRAWYNRISPISHTQVILQVDPASGDEFETVCEGCYEIENTFIFAWSSIPSIAHFRWLFSLMYRLPLNSKVDYLVCTIQRILDFL